MTSPNLAYKSFDNENLHGPFYPENIRENEMVHAKLSKETDLNNYKDYRVWRISPLGVELVIEETDQLMKGIDIQLELTIGHQAALLKGLVVDNIVEEAGQKIAHIRLVKQSEEQDTSLEKRTRQRWSCSNEFYPTGIAVNPVRFNDFIYFKIVDISFGGMKLIVSLRNKFLISGTTLDSMINFPMVSQCNIKLHVKNVRVENFNDKDVLAVGVTYDTKNKVHQKVLTNYVLQFSNIKSLDELTQNGFEKDKISGAVEYTFVKTKKDFEEVMQLRFEAYKKAGKVSPSASIFDMTDQYDAKSRIVIGKIKGEIVCTARMIFHQLGEKLEQEQYVEWSSDLPRQDEVVEIMRACTKPGYRGSDLLIGMFKFMSIIVAQAKKKWIVICATDDMTHFYEKVGFEKTHKSYLHTKLNNTQHHVMIANFLNGMSGKNISPIYWNLVWSDSVDYMSQYNLIEFDPLMQIRVTIYKWFKPLANYFYRRKLNKK